MKNVSDLRQGGGFLRFPPSKKADRHDITDILLKVALNTMPQTLTQLKAITFKNKHEVLLSCYFPLTLDTKYKYNDSMKMKKVSFLSGLSMSLYI